MPPVTAPLAPLPGSPDADAILERFLTATSERGLSLYPEQEEAILELFADRNVILNTPTGSGKSLVAAAFHFRALCTGQRSIYTCPIKALVNEKFLALCRDFGPENVGMMTGDASVNPRAPVLCCTAEILANIALHRGEQIDAVHRSQATVAPADGSTHRFDDHYICHRLRPLELDFVEHIRLAAGNRGKTCASTPWVVPGSRSATCASAP